MGKNRSFTSSGQGEIAALGEARKRGILSDDFGFAYIFSEASNLAKVVITKEKVVTIVISLQIFRLMYLYGSQNPMPPVGQTNVSRVAWRMVSAIQSANSPVFLVLTPRIYH